MQVPETVYTPIWKGILEIAILSLYWQCLSIVLDSQVEYASIWMSNVSYG